LIFPLPIIACGVEDADDDDRVRTADEKDAVRKSTSQRPPHFGLAAQADLALAEEAMLTGDFPGVRTLAQRAEAALPPGPLRLRAADLRHAAQRDNMTREQREQEKDAMRRRPRP